MVKLDPESIVALFTIILAVSTILLWWETRRLAQGAKDQAADFRRSVAAAEESALAARRSADIAERALIGIQRAILVVDIRRTNDAVPPPDQPSASHRVELAITIENVGLLPAYLDECVAEVRAIERQPQEDLAPPVPGQTEFHPAHCDDLLEHRLIIRPKEQIELTYTGFLDMSGDLLSKCWGTSPRRLFFFGLARYSDPLGVRRELGFTFFYQPLRRPAVWTVLDSFPASNFDRIAGG